MQNLFLYLIPIAALVGLALFVALVFRRVVPTNAVHIVQSGKKTVSYGAGKGNGNTYYQWPAWLPFIGVTVTELPISVFNLNLKAYEAYDKDKLPFEVDITSFFRIDDSDVAASRVSSFEQLKEQLLIITQGTVRTVLANSHIEEIMTQRSTFGEKFTLEVTEQLKHWGVCPVKNIELMDIRDSEQNKVIHNIMAKKKSEIESESRQAVAMNIKNAQIAETNAKKESDVIIQDAELLVGQRTAEKNKQVGISQEKARQDIMEQAKITQQKEMEVVSVKTIRNAEITRDAAIVKADETKQVAIIQADGALQSKKLEAEGIEINGKAIGEAKKAELLAPVNAQLELARGIADNEKYTTYLVNIRTVEKDEKVGIEQAKALQTANIKVIANTGDPVEGVSNVMELFSSKGGTALAGMAEAFAQSDEGKLILSKLNNKPKE